MTDLDTLDVPGWDAVIRAGAVPPPPGDVLARAQAAVAAAAADEPFTLPRPTPLARPVRRRRRRLAVGLATAAAIAAAVLVAPTVGLPGGSPPRASAEAAALLARAADITAADPPTRPGQFWRVETRSRDVHGTSTPSGDSAVLADTRRVEWRAVDGTGAPWFDDTRGPVVAVLSGTTLEQARRDHPVTRETWTMVTTGEAVGTWQAPTPSWLAALPRDPQELRKRLYADSDGHGRSKDGEALVHVADLLRSGQVPADLRAALYRVLETVPGVEITAEQATVLGRPGVAIGRFETVDGERQEIIIDPATGEFVGERSVDGSGNVLGQATVVRTVVDDVPADVRSRARVDTCTAAPDGAVACTPGG